MTNSSRGVFSTSKLVWFIGLVSIRGGHVSLVCFQRFVCFLVLVLVMVTLGASETTWSQKDVNTFLNEV